MVYRHKKTGRLLLLKKLYSSTAALFVLDDDRDKIPENEAKTKFKTAVCHIKNLEPLGLF